MQHDFWHQRWQEGRIGFHRGEVMPLLEKHWPALQLPAADTVLVPLAGKSLDMVWLATQGHRVLGVELSPLAVGPRGPGSADLRTAGVTAPAIS